MSLLGQALRAGLQPTSAADARTQALVLVGAAGPLGSAVLEQLLGRRRWSRVFALVTQPIEVALTGLEAVQVDEAVAAGDALPAPAETALVVFDREQSSRGREAAFLRPDPAALPALAKWLQGQGARRLLIVMPHAPALLPQALKAGLANLDEQAVAALGFEQLVIVRPARATGPAHGLSAALSWPAKLARTLLSQLHWMVPQRDQPLRAQKVAEFVARLAQLLPEASSGTRVAPPELLWDWAQPDGGDGLLADWMGNGHWQSPAATGRRW